MSNYFFHVYTIVFLSMVNAVNAFGCAVCGTVNDPARDAFLLSTALLSAIPLLAIAGIIFYLYRRSH